MLGGDSSYSSNGGSIPQGRVFGGKPQETEITRGLDNQGVVTYQREALKGLSWSLSLLRGVAFINQLTFWYLDQDQTIQHLHTSILRQKEIAVAIGDELDVHNGTLSAC